MSNEKSKPRSIKELLNANSSQIDEWASQRSLPDPQELEQEYHLGKTLLSPNQERNEKAPQPTKRIPFWQQPWLWAPTLSAAAILVLWWSPWSSPQQPHTLIRKGQTKQVKSKNVALHLGVWSTKNRKVRRLGSGDVCQPYHNVSFAFTLHQSAGYVYLFLENETGKVIRLYPQDRHVWWKQGYSELKVKEVPQHYGLRKHKGTIRFAVVKTKGPLTQGQTNSILQSKPLLVQLQRLQASSSPGFLSFDSSTVKVQQR